MTVALLSALALATPLAELEEDADFGLGSDEGPHEVVGGVDAIAGDWPSIVGVSYLGFPLSAGRPVGVGGRRRRLGPRRWRVDPGEP